MRDASRDGGFTLIEMMIAMALLALFMIGILGLLDQSRRVAKTESALADTQENVRYAAYHLLRTTRMAGGGLMPFADAVSGNFIAARLLDNETAFTDDFGGNHTSVAGSDVLNLRGLFETSPYFVNPGIDLVSSTFTIRESVGDPASTADDQDMNVAANDFAGKGLLLLGRRGAAIAQVQANTAASGTAPNRSFTITLEPPNPPWDGLNPGGAYSAPVLADVFQLGILDSYTYWVEPRTFRLMRVRNGGAEEPVAVNIGSLQCELGVDSDEDGVVNEPWLDEPTIADVTAALPGDPVPVPLAIRITVFGRTQDPVANWSEPATTFDPFAGLSAVVDHRSKWRRMQVVATLRDYAFSQGTWE